MILKYCNELSALDSNKLKKDFQELIKIQQLPNSPHEFSVYFWNCPLEFSIGQTSSQDVDLTQCEVCVAIKKRKNKMVWYLPSY